MSSTHIEISIREIDFHIKSTEQTYTLQYLIIGPYSEDKAFMELITPNELDNIIVFPKTVYFNKYLDVFEFCVTFGKGEQQNG